MNVLDLFSGIGGFSLGLERAGGFKTVAFCEIDPYCRRVLAKHWPGVPIFEDIRRLVADPELRYLDPEEPLQAGRDESGDGSESGRTRVGPIDVITGGFPCQDISVAGRGAGIDGERSGLWSELARIIGEVRPTYAILENVSALLSRGMDRVAGDLAEVGYDCEWHCIPASYVGAPHRRDRWWCVAYPQGVGGGARCGGDRTRQVDQPTNRSQAVADPGWGRYGLSQRLIQAGWNAAKHGDWWNSEPNVGRVAHGIPRRVDRLKGLGNAVVPQIPELIGRTILEYERAA